MEKLAKQNTGTARKSHTDKMELNKQHYYYKKERQEVLAFYLRPDVQNVVSKHEDVLGKFYDKLVGAQSPDERDTLRMRLRAYSY